MVCQTALLRRRLALALTAVPHRLFNHRCAKGRRVDFEQRIFHPLKDLPIKFVGSLRSRSGRSGQSGSPAELLLVIGIENKIRRNLLPQAQILRPEVQDRIEELFDWFPKRTRKIIVGIAVLVEDVERGQKCLQIEPSQRGKTRNP